jgi:hypothetical protein
VARRTRAALAVLAAMLPATAEANSGIGLLVHATPAMIVALPVAILLESPVLARGLRVPFRRALGLSSLANVISTLIGFVGALGLDFILLAFIGSSGSSGGRGVMLVALVPMFFITWWLEAWLVAANCREASRRRATLSTLAANGVSYTIMAIGVLAWAPQHGGLPREHIVEALMEMQVPKLDAAETFQKTGRFGPPRELPARARSLKALRVEADGSVVGTLAGGRLPELEGKSIRLRPRIENGAIVEWQCSAQIPGKYLPANCR